MQLQQTSFFSSLAMYNHPCGWNAAWWINHIMNSNTCCSEHPQRARLSHSYCARHDQGSEQGYSSSCSPLQSSQGGWTSSAPWVFSAQLLGQHQLAAAVILLEVLQVKKICLWTYCKSQFLAIKINWKGDSNF